MPSHVFVETNWVVEFAAPAHLRSAIAEALLIRAGAGEFRLQIPAICLREGENTIYRKFQPKAADHLREFRRWARKLGLVPTEENEHAIKFLDRYEETVRAGLSGVRARLNGLEASPGVDVYPLTQAMLERALSLRTEVSSDLQPFDEAILAAVLERARELQEVGAVELVFCELDSDLQPWTKGGTRREEVARLYDAVGVWVYGDFEMRGPSRPPGWPAGAAGHDPSAPSTTE
ncbi:MAG: hypothetical protein KF878_10645 [Planctomycetes bacterium]|nr:hypothetical protein [Planctomycetota bacterium]